MINVIYLISFFEPSGPINQALNIVTGFDSQKVNVTVVTLFPEKKLSWIDRFVSRGVDVVQLNCGDLSFFTARSRLARIIKERNIQVVHSSGLRAAIVNALLPKGVLKVITVRSHVTDLEEHKNRLVKYAAKNIFCTILKRIDVLVACSKSLASDLNEETGLSFKSVQNGVDSDVYVPLKTQDKMILRGKLGIPLGNRVFVSAGVLYPRKNMSLIVRSFTQLSLKDCTLLIVGDGEEMTMLQEMAKGNDNIRFVGKQNNMLPYYQVSDIFISSSLAEGLPNTVLEAMSCGLPCILSDIGSHKEILDYDLETGIIVSLTKKSWSEDLQKAVSWDLTEKSVKARELIENHLSKYKMAEKYASLYQENI